MPPRSASAPTAVDVFAGGGGLTVGLKRAGFRMVGAVELEPRARATYSANHPEVEEFPKDVVTVSGKAFKKASPTGQVDLLAGCPPCQGFTSLTSKYRRTDPRNKLVAEMGRLARELRPKALMLENVPGLALRGRRLLNALIKDLESLGYHATWDVLQVADYGVPQNRKRLVVLAGLGFDIPIPKPTHARKPEGRIKPWRSVRDTIGKMPRPVTLQRSHELGGPGAVDWHVVRQLTDVNRDRLKSARPGAVWMKLPRHLRAKCHQGRKSGFENSYGRMSWASISPTITGGCTTISMGRFGHPSQRRALSVREAALLQTFPPDYVFDTEHMEPACRIIGNALPCDFAHKLAVACLRAIRANSKPARRQVKARPAASA